MAEIDPFRAEDEAGSKARPFAGADVTADDTGRAMRGRRVDYGTGFVFTMFRTPSSEIAPACSVAAVRRRVALCDQRRRACLYGRAQPASIVIWQVQEA